MGLSKHGDLLQQLIEESCNNLAQQHIKDHVRALCGSKSEDINQLFLDLEEKEPDNYIRKYKVIKEACENNKVLQLPIPDDVTDDDIKDGELTEKPKSKPKPKKDKGVVGHRKDSETLDAVRSLLGGGGEVTEDTVMQYVLPHLQDLQSEVKALKNRPNDKLDIKFNGEINTVTGHKHMEFESFLRVITSRDEKGSYIPLWLWGDPGSGKSYLAWQLGSALGQEVYEKSVSPTDTAATIMGYKNLVNGDYVEGLAYKPYKEGGVLWIDEVCNSDPSLPISMNGLISGSRATFPNGETIQKHKDFRVMVADNTKGTGATGGFRRQKMDVAFVNRFAQREVQYDEKLERSIANPQGSKAKVIDNWVTYVQAVRAYVKKNSPANVYITPRVSINGAAMLRNGLEWDWVADSTLFSPLSSELVETIKQNIKTSKYKK
ncbi:MAG: hypothetical protein CMM02_18205 [Rhodopirellula sp.]|nr:hypothetical protein [Rhodopirellula sp.]|tara:strand:- start:1911 stop:3209 length:1299 start_codon:yes stop_codon:yes gene_type:complete